MFTHLSGYASLAHAAAAPHWEKLIEPTFQHITSEQGLPRGLHLSLAQDKSGFLWIGTTNGLARWDGYRIRTYRPKMNDHRSLPDNHVQVINIDQRGRLWIGTSGGGLARYEPAEDNFTRFPVGEGGLSSISINGIESDGAGGVWVGTDKGLNHVHGDTSKVTQFRANESQHGDLPETKTSALLHAKNGDLWVGTSKGLFLRPKGDTRFQSIPLSSDQAAEFVIYRLFSASNGRLWISTSNNGLYWRDPTNGNIHPFSTNTPQDEGPQKDWVTSIAEPRPGEIWFGTFINGIVVLNSATQHTYRIQRDPTLPSSLPGNKIFAVFTDTSGLIWVSTSIGVSRHNPGNQAIRTMFGNEQRPDKLSGTDVRSILSLDNGSIWAGIDKSGIDILHPEQGRTSTLPLDTKQSQNGLQGRIFALLSTGPNTVYLGADSGLYRANSDGSQLQKVAMAGRSPASSNVRALLLHGNDLYIGSTDGLWIHHLSTAPVLQRMRPKGAEQLTDQRINVMAHGPDGSIWIGTRNGLNNYDPVTHKLRQFMPDANNPNALSPGGIESLLFDQTGRLWIGSSSGGVNILERSGEQAIFRRIGSAQGLPNDGVNCLLADRAGKIWVSTDEGLAVIDPASMKIRALLQADGVSIQTYLTHSCATTPEGELLFGGLGGITMVRPALLSKWTFQPPLVLSEIRVGGQPIIASRFYKRFYKNNQTDPLFIPSNANKLSVEFSALDFSAPEQNRYTYQLEGYDSDWVEAESTRRIATYTRLPPGEYNFRVRGWNRTGESAAQELNIPLNVAAAWYQTWWFHWLEIVFLLALVLAIVHIRTRYLEQNRHRLEHDVAQRTSELQANQQELMRANQDLNHANNELAQSADTLRELGQIGRDITANLDLQAAFDTVHEHVMRMLDAPSLIIHRFNPELAQLELAFGREFGETVPPHVIPLKSRRSNSARAAREQQEILVETDTNHAGQLRTSRNFMTALYMPLLINQRLVGVMSVQSALPRAYGERERLIFRNLCAYGAIALDNAKNYQQLQETQTKLVEQEKLAALGSLVAGVAHELNTPIGNSLLMLTTLQSKTTEFDEKVNAGQLRRSDLQAFLDDSREASEVIMRGLSSAAALVSSFKQVAVDRTTAHQRLFNLSLTSQEIIATMMNKIKLEGHHIELDIGENITLNSYPGPYGQVIANFINNALLHAFEGQSDGMMRLIARQETPERVTIEFHDNGKGIAADHLKRIFDPFFTTKLGQGGSGLGLSISYNIVTSLLNGRIRVESTPGKGSCFILDLPVMAPIAPVAPVAPIH